MPDESQPTDRPEGERRLIPRFPSRSIAVVLRDSDLMRLGITGRVIDISVVGVGIVLPEPLEVGEQIKMRLKNEIQRFERETRGFVRHVTPRDDGTFQIGVSLQLRLTPFEVSLLKLASPGGDDNVENSSDWV